MQKSFNVEKRSASLPDNDSGEGLRGIDAISPSSKTTFVSPSTAILA